MIYDASAFLALLFLEEKASLIGRILEGDDFPALPATGLTEILIAAERRSGQFLDPTDSWPSIVPVSAEIASKAARFYSVARIDSPKISLADCIALATAVELDTRVVTLDRDFRVFNPLHVLLA